MFLEISLNSQENAYAIVSFLMKLQAEACDFIKKRDSGTGVSCEFSKISKNTFLQNTSAGLFLFLKHLNLRYDLYMF